MNEWMNFIIEESSKENKLTKKQQNILISAIELISEKGYEKVSTAEIAQRAGVAEGTIFRQYKTKKDLLNTIVIPSFMKFVAPNIFKNFVDEVIDKEYVTFDEFVTELVEDRLEFVKKNTPLIKILIQEIIAQDHIKSEIKNLFIKYVYNSMVKVLETFKTRGEIIDIPPITVFRIIISNLMGYLVPRFILYPDLNWDDEKEKQIIIQSIVKALKK